MMSSHPAAPQPKPASTEPHQRQDLMRLCAMASEAELAEALALLAPLPDLVDVRPPEAGLVMVRGRIGGTGAPFNCGEATVARATIALARGPVGYGYVLGRSLNKARLAATIDALGQTEQYGAAVRRHLTEVTGARVARERGQRQAEVGATRVEFFTMQRGED